MDETLVREMLAAGAVISITIYRRVPGKLFPLQQELILQGDKRFFVHEAEWEGYDGYVAYWNEEYDSLEAAWQAMKEWAAQSEEILN